MIARTPEEFSRHIYDTATAAVLDDVPHDGERFKLTGKMLKVKRDVVRNKGVELQVDTHYNTEGQLTLGRAFIGPSFMPVPDIIEGHFDAGVRDNLPVFDSPNVVADLALRHFGISLAGIAEFDSLTDPTTDLSDLCRTLRAYDIRRTYTAEKQIRCDMARATLIVYGAEWVSADGGHKLTGPKGMEEPRVLLRREVSSGMGVTVNQNIRILTDGFLHNLEKDNMSGKTLPELQQWLEPAVPLDYKELPLDTWARLVEEPLSEEDLFGLAKDINSIQE